jgi:hypothetical protein
MAEITQITGFEMRIEHDLGDDASYAGQSAFSTLRNVTA